MADHQPAELRFLYRNHRGEIAWRWVAPRLVRWGTSEHHPEPQWLLEGIDLDKAAERTFALKDVQQWGRDTDWKVLLDLTWAMGVVDDVEWLQGYSQRNEQRYLVEHEKRKSAESEVARLREQLKAVWLMLDHIAVQAKYLADQIEVDDKRLAGEIDCISDSAINMLREHEVPDPPWGKRLTREEMDREEGDE